MAHWWEIPTAEELQVVRSRAVAYYRHSAQDRQENSIPIQQEQVRQWAEQRGVEIIHEFKDAGKSGLTAEGRPAFTEMMEEWVKKRGDFAYVICLDVSRWGRFQDLDLSAQYSSECKRHGKNVVYTAIGIEEKDNPLFSMDNVFLTPHNAALTREAMVRMALGAAQGIDEVLTGRRPTWPVNEPAARREP